MIPLWISTESLLPEEPFSVDGLVTSKSRSENHRNGLSEGVSKETQPLETNPRMRVERASASISPGLSQRLSTRLMAR